MWTFAGPHADLSIRNDAAGDAITLLVKNDGPDTVDEVVVAHYLVGRSGSWTFVEEVKFARVTPSQGQCSAPEERILIASPPGPPFWAVDCTVGALAAGASMTIEVMIQRTSGSGPFSLTSIVSPQQNDPRPENNVTEVRFPTPPRRRSVR